MMVLLFPVHVVAQSMQYVPTWHLVNGEACYGFDDAKKLVGFDSQMTLLTAEVDDQTKLVASLHLTITNLQGALDTTKKEVTVLQGNTGTLTQNMNDCIARANKAEAGSGPSAGWLVAGGVVLLAAGVLLGAFVIARK